MSRRGHWGCAGEAVGTVAFAERSMVLHAIASGATHFLADIEAARAARTRTEAPDETTCEEQPWWTAADTPPREGPVQSLFFLLPPPPLPPFLPTSFYLTPHGAAACPGRLSLHF